MGTTTWDDYPDDADFVVRFLSAPEERGRGGTSRERSEWGRSKGADTEGNRFCVIDTSHHESA